MKLKFWYWVHDKLEEAWHWVYYNRVVPNQKHEKPLNPNAGFISFSITSPAQPPTVTLKED